LNEKNRKKRNKELKKYLPLQRFREQMIVLQFKKGKENEKISFDVRSCCSYFIRILRW